MTVSLANSPLLLALGTIVNALERIDEDFDFEGLRGGFWSSGIASMLPRDFVVISTIFSKVKGTET